ncbi:PREDICTED: pentatricopeptide repeat-containing protein At1g62260, mitochondrial isoform X2 [Tarenaya hassleriana]|uniref:pentatricopeptide repeat-containing protein At1g62260, mitochondrial isoform X2 n=1 Tax=Tarenaya hassleriana TaxID=28532 RepID=UPI0008FCE6DF|nr:PREDICTED: pentatricopeptide repeat-containing protein At1g62260, mitochondrial isoform X2 [Tarenaya hassleriana]
MVLSSSSASTGGNICRAREIFNEMEERNTVTWNTMISGYVKRREMAQARRLFDEMPERDVVSWNTMISGYVSCSGARFLEEARSLFDAMPVRDCISWNTMISGYAKHGRMEEAVWLFNKMPERNAVSWNAMITGFCQNGNVGHAIEFFERLPERNSASLCALVSGLIQNEKLDEAARILAEYGRKDAEMEDLVYAYNTLISGYGQKGNAEAARRIFDQIPDDLRLDRVGQIKGKFRRNLVSWNSMIMSYVKAGDVVSARELFDQMTERDIISWNTMIDGYVRASKMKEALDLFYEMPKHDTFSWNTIVSGYANVGNLDLSRHYFDRTPQKSIVSWNSIIAAYQKNEDYKGAAEMFIWMKSEGEKPDRHTLSSLLSISTGLVNPQLGMQIHQVIIKTVIPDMPITNALITMYSACGAINDARRIFNETKPRREVITWNAMIRGYASHGYAEEALTMFRTMKNCKIQPTYITFISVLSACVHAGLVEEAKTQFKSMVGEFNIEPRIEHYAALVDVISRDGQVEEAMEVIRTMHLAPDRAVWGALLGGCRVHNNVGLARVAAEELMRLEPESSTPYVLLYNMYADMGMWDEASAVRKVMESRNIVKARGSSWTESSLTGR